MPNQVDGALVRAPCPVPSCPACEPNSGSVLPSLSTKATGVEGPTLLCNQVAPLGFPEVSIWEVSSRTVVVAGTSMEHGTRLQQNCTPRKYRGLGLTRAAASLPERGFAFRI
jgi:hypothetical protein